MQPNFEIDLSDTFIFASVIGKTNRNEYSNVEEWFNDIRRTLAFVIWPFNLIYTKNTDSGIRYYLSEISNTKLKEILQHSKPHFEVPLREEPNDKTKTKSENRLYQYIIEHQEELTYDRIALLNKNDKTNPDERVLNLFHRFVYTGKRDDKLLETYLGHIREVICDNDLALNEYVLNMLAFYI